MTSRKEDKEEGILERMLERLALVGRNVERLVKVEEAMRESTAKE